MLMYSPALVCWRGDKKKNSISTDVENTNRLTRTNLACPGIASEAWQSRRRSKHRSPKGIARFVKDRASLLAMTKWVRVRANRSSLWGAVLPLPQMARPEIRHLSYND